MLRIDCENFIDMKVCFSEWIVSSESTVGVLYLGQSLQFLNTHFYESKLTSIDVSVINLVIKEK